MGVLERLRALTEPIVDEYGDSREILLANDELNAPLRVRRVRFRSVLLKRVADASVAFSLRHMFRRTSAAVIAAIRQVTPEMTWLKNYPSPRPSGRENTWGVN